ELEGLQSFDAQKPVLVVGLGNRFITADALGPKAVDRIFVTRHMHAQLGEYFGDALASVCAVAPGVLGITGVETAEIVEGVCARVKPGLILVIDALAARSVHRINTTVQISDTGITPGSGVGNHRAAFNKERFGVPVIAIGVPTVIDAMTMAYDAAYSVLHAVQSQAGDTLSCMQNLTDADLYAIVENLMRTSVGDLTVTPKEVDFAMERISKVVAGGINLYLHKELSVAELSSLTM
ncbi:MAG: GPR endopeptidase, partial [Clostridia bacterium]|nr:GPR endopeptidase [Clostridia bacterium]